MGRKEVKQGAPGGSGRGRGVAALIHGLMWVPLSLVELDQIRFRFGYKERLIIRSVRNLAF